MVPPFPMILRPRFNISGHEFDRGTTVSFVRADEGPKYRAPSAGGPVTADSRLSDRFASVRDQDRAGDIAREIGCEEQNRVCDLLRLPEAAHGNAEQRFFRSALDHRRANDAGAHGITADSAIGIFDRGRLGELNDTRLRYRIR